MGDKLTVTEMHELLTELVVDTYADEGIPGLKTLEQNFGEILDTLERLRTKASALAARRSG